ncbi:MAG: hypothetical protein ACLU0O_06795 [Collinsella sp.]
MVHETTPAVSIAEPVTMGCRIRAGSWRESPPYSGADRTHKDLRQAKRRDIQAGGVAAGGD